MRRERFGLFWSGKTQAIAPLSNTTATLKPDFENSKDWDTTQNVFIEGDNLESTQDFAETLLRQNQNDLH